MAIIQGSVAGPTAPKAEDEAALQIAAVIKGIPIAAGAACKIPLLRLSRDQAAQYLSMLGYETTANRLAKLAVHGGGPPYSKWGRRVIYHPLNLLEWATSRESNVHSSTGGPYPKSYCPICSGCWEEKAESRASGP